MGDDKKTNKERLICIEGLLNTVITWQSNHMEHHKKLYDRIFKVCLAMFVGGLTFAGALVIAVVVWKLS